MSVPHGSAGGTGAGQATGCYKCGRPGHWSWDCTLLPGKDAGAERDRPAAGGSFGGEGKAWSEERRYGGGKGGQSGFQRNAEAKEPIRKEPKKRPKLTADLLLSEDGLGYVLEKMPEMITIKGRKESVVSDLGNLLEGYMHWHALLLPYFSFEQFVEKVEKLGASKRVRMCTRELRDKIEYGKGQKDDKDTEVPANEKSPLQHSPSKAGPEKEAAGGVSPEDLFTNDEPEMPVNDLDFEEFFRQGVEVEDTHPFSAVEGGSAPGLQPECSSVGTGPSLAEECGSEGGNAPGLQSESSPSRQAGNGDSVPRVAAGSSISETARVRMEANRLKALERAQARLAGNVLL